MGNARNIAFWVVLFLLILALFNLFGNGQSTMNSRTLTYSDFIQKVEANDVRSVVIDGEQLQVQTNDGTNWIAIKPEGQQLNENLVELLIDKGVVPHRVNGVDIAGACAELYPVRRVFSQRRLSGTT